jgi:hypothetical protein
MLDVNRFVVVFALLACLIHFSAEYLVNKWCDDNDKIESESERERMRENETVKKAKKQRIAGAEVDEGRA